MAEENGSSRLDRLRGSVSRIRTGSSGLPVDRAQLIVGGILLVFGFSAILIGWYGAAHTPYLFEQVPYLISGGLLGLGLAFLGAFVYFAYWVARLLRESREQSTQVAQALGRIEGLLEREGALTPSRTPNASPNGVFWATPQGTMFHTGDCAVVFGVEGLRKVSADDEDLEPCQLCHPLSS